MYNIINWFLSISRSTTRELDYLSVHTIILKYTFTSYFKIYTIIIIIMANETIMITHYTCVYIARLATGLESIVKVLNSSKAFKIAHFK
uniref:Uncharacterized protein n=1 Tax=Amphimedon queenslandica TaxID=400682 RepID=A0A1X7VII9_AMPQE